MRHDHIYDDPSLQVAKCVKEKSDVKLSDPSCSEAFIIVWWDPFLRCKVHLRGDEILLSSSWELGP